MSLIQAAQFGAKLLGSVSKGSLDLTGVPEEFRGLLQEQQKMNKEQELVTYMSKLLKHKHDCTMSILNNMK
jgi:hypothetical protein